MPLEMWVCAQEALLGWNPNTEVGTEAVNVREMALGRAGH